MRYLIRTGVFAAVAFGALVSPAVGLAQNRLIATVGTNDSQVITLTQENGSPVNDIPAARTRSRSATAPISTTST